MNYLDDSLIKATLEAKIPSLPPLFKPTDKMWDMAIVLITKSNMQKEYAIAKNEITAKMIDGKLVVKSSPSIVKTFGSPSMIVKIEDIRPFKDIDDEFIPKFKKVEECVAFILSKLRLDKDEYGIAELDKESLKLLTYFAANK